jgi:two-component system, chemotaxis family, protein-glutamate methylesterase/glutaminase
MAFADGVVVIGASAGGVSGLREVVDGLPADLPAAVFVVLHVPAYKASALPEILNVSAALPASHPRDGEGIETGRIYVAPPDHHLLVEHGYVAVKKGPKENRFRPSIDALFRSAAYNYGPRVIGVVLSGGLDDGTSGLWSIKRLGGKTIVQHPADAQFESMVENALSQVEVDYTLPAREIGPLLSRLLAEPPIEAVKDEPDLRKRLKIELAIAVEGGAFQKGVMEIGELTPFTCPECHGVLVKLTEEARTRYRCHTGHAYTDSALLDGVMESTGDMLWQVMRGFEEAVMVVEHMAEHLRVAGDVDRAAVYAERARELEARSRLFHELVLQHRRLSGENLEETSIPPITP